MRNELGSWSTLLRRHRYLLCALALLVSLCTVYLFFAVTLGTRDPCFGLSESQRASCNMEQIKGKVKNMKHF